MFIVLLRLSDNRGKAGELMEDHNMWLERGFEDGVFLLVGSLQPRQGGAILAHNISLSELQDRVKEDPFVARKVVEAEILEVTPAETDSRLAFLRAE